MSAAPSMRMQPSQTLVRVAGARGSGFTYRRVVAQPPVPVPAAVPTPQPAVPPPSALSKRAQALGLFTAEDVEAEYRAAKSGWSKGNDYHCPFCNREFWSPSGARKHMSKRGHKVLRVDWYR